MEPVYLFFAEGSEEVEALAVVDILRRAGVDTRIVSVTGEKMVSGAHGIRVEADLLAEEVDYAHAAMLVLPGGLSGAYNLAAHQGLAEGVRTQYEAGKPLAAICAAPLVYGRMGLLKGLKATCYPGFESNLEGATYTGALVEKDGLFTTGKGPAAVFEFGYALAAQLVGKDKSEAVRQGMLYNEVAP
ncbi:MAG: DJ-1/PfpI family protein [Paraprevotella sp.]|nr:DJ-1/PfpI family protein [Paraprevotella sp.]